MDRKRPADAYIKPDPELKRVKKEDSGDYFDLSSIPRASPLSAEYSSSTVVKTESNGGRKPLHQTSHNPARRPPINAKSRQFGGQSLMVRRGPNWVRAHLNKRDMIVDFAIHYGRGVSWDLGGVEKEIFERLHRAYMFVEPVEKPGYLDNLVGRVEEHLDMLPWLSSSIGKPYSSPVQMSFDGKQVLVKISQNMYRDFVYLVAVRPFEGQGQTAVRTEDTHASQHPWGMHLKQLNIKSEEDVKIEEEKSNVLVSVL